MITEIEAENVRVFEGKNYKFKLSALTVFCGTNSSGKSTLLKLLPMLRQSIERSGGVAGEGRLCYSGSLVDMGNYQSLVSHNEVARDIHLSISMDRELRSDQYNHLMSIRRKKNKQNSNSDSPTVRCTIMAKFQFSGKSPQANPDLNEQNDRLVKAEYSLIHNDIHLLNWTATLRSKEDKHDLGSDYKLSIPTGFFRHVGGFELMDIAPHKKGAKFVEVGVRMNSVVPRFIWAKRKSTRTTETSTDKQPRANYTLLPLPPFIETTCNMIESQLAVDYIAPLRASAKRYSIAHSASDRELDPAGELLPIFLKSRRTQKRLVQNVRLGQNSATSESLIDAVNYWLGYLRSGHGEVKRDSEIEIATTRDILIEFKVRSVNGNEFHSMADSGFGYSQIFPIIVRGLLMKKDGTLLIEQPELHLNPSLQVRLADFLFSLIRAGKQLIIETHSEHIVNALRVLIAEDEGSYLSKHCAIYFIDTQAGKAPEIHHLSIREDGTVPEWPKNFFGEALNLSGRLLRAQRRRIVPSTPQQT